MKRGAVEGIDAEEGAAEAALADKRTVSCVRCGVVCVNSIVDAFLTDRSGTLPWFASLIPGIANAFGVVAFVPYHRLSGRGMIRSTTGRSPRVGGRPGSGTAIVDPR